MMTPSPTRRRKRPSPSEDGYILVAVIFMLALLTLALSIALPKMAKEIQRDRELETVHRGKQYIRAVKMYYKKFGAFPPSMDALVNTNQMRFLRKKYKDPTTGKDEWKLIQFGQAKTQSTGFFGQPLMGGAVGGNLGGGGLTGTGPGAGGVPPTSGSVFGGGTGSVPIVPGGIADPNDPTAGAPGLTGPTFGGMGMIGVSPTSPKQSILSWRKKNHYNEWEFIYDPMADLTTIGSGGPPVPVQPGAPGITNPTPTPPPAPTPDPGGSPPPTPQ